MKILCVIDSLGSGGAQRQMSYLALGLKAHGHDVELFLYQPTQTHFRPLIEAAGILIHEVPRDGSTGFSWRVLRQLIGRFAAGFDAVVSFQPTANVYSAMAKLAVPSVRLVAGERTSFVAAVPRARRIAAWIASLLSSCVVANSESHSAHLRRFPGLSRKVVAIWNGYETATALNPAPRPRENGLERLLVVARLSPEKNGLRFLLALDLFQKRHGWMPKVQWAGRRDADPACQRIQREMDQFLLDHPGVAANWDWLGEVKNVQDLYVSSDALILPSLYEGLPNAVCEAMLAGCPVIASNVCDHPRLLGEQGERGLLCDPLSPEAICDALERMNALGAQGREDMARRACDFAREHLTLDRMVESYEKVLSQGAAALQS